MNNQLILKNQYPIETKAIIFAMSIIALMAKQSLASNERNIVNSNILSSTDFWKYAKYMGNPRSLLMRAMHDNLPYETHAKRISRLFTKNSKLLLQSMETLISYTIGKDMLCNRQQMHNLYRIGAIWGVSEKNIHYILYKKIVPKVSDDWMLLDLKKGSDIEKIKKAYYAKIKWCHPDSFAGKDDIPVELISLLKERFAIYSGAYNNLRAKKKFKIKKILEMI
ncbi:MAG: J domain-containing protein [Pseudomonadota bacterium]